MRRRWRPALLLAGMASTFIAVTGSSHAAAVQTAGYRYGLHTHQALDAYWQEADRSVTRPGLVIVHGGYWNGGGKADWASTAQWYAQRGFAVFNVDHRLNTEAPWPAPRDDVLSALGWIKSHAEDFGVDPDRIAVLGSQAGGQLAVQAGTYGAGDARVRGVVGLSAIASPGRAYNEAQTTAASLIRRTIRDQSVILANCTPALAEQACKSRFSDMGVSAQASAGDAPMLLVHSAGDTVPISHAKDAKAKLAAAGVTDVTVRTVAGGASGGGLLDDALRTQILGWLRTRTADRPVATRQVTTAESATLRTTRPGSLHAADDGDKAAGLSSGPAATGKTGKTGTAGSSAVAGSGRTVATAAGTRFEVSRAFGTGAQQQLDAYYYKPAGTQPALVVLHGGYWYEGDKSDWVGTPRWFADRGYAVFVINYRLNTEAAWSAQRTDVLTALAWIKANAADFSVDPTRVLMLGSSAGGHLATNVGTYGTGSSHVKAVAALSPVASPYRAYHDGQAAGAVDEQRKLRDTALLLARCTPVKSDAKCWRVWQDLVTENAASTGDAPVYTIHSKNEFVPPAHSSGLCKKLKAKKVSCTNVVVPGSRHAGSVFKVAGVQDDLLKWLKAHD